MAQAQRIGWTLHPLPDYPTLTMTRTFQTICCCAGLAISLFAASEIAAPAPRGWVRVVTDRSNRVWFVDSGSLQKRGNIRYFWSYIIGAPPYPEAGRLVHSTAYYLSADCQAKSFRLRFVRLLDENNKTIKEQNYGDSRPMGAVASGSGEAASLKFACSR